MRQRCYYKESEYYHLYGGRGISVCDRWKNSFENFYEDMGERSEGMTLDRKDNSKGYFKENCKWATHKEQVRNRRYAKKGKETPMGVSFHKVTGKWQASIRVNNKQKYLGIYSSIEEACKVRKEAEEKYYD